MLVTRFPSALETGTHPVVSYLRPAPWTCRIARTAPQGGRQAVRLNSVPGDGSPGTVERRSRELFLETVRTEPLHLARAALLVSLEEHAAAEAYKESATIYELWAEDVSIRPAFLRSVSCICRTQRAS